MSEGESRKKLSKNQDAQATQQLTQQQTILEFYHVNSLEELVEIMVNAMKSQAYRKISAQSVQQIGVSTLKASYQYKKQILSKTINSFQQSNTPNKKKQQISKFVTGVNRQAMKLAQHTYEELLTFFEGQKYNKQLCKKILLIKYSEGDVLKTHRYRKKVWIELLNLQNKYLDHPQFYQVLSNLSHQNKYKDYFDKVIHADVIRTIHENDKFIESNIIAQMQRILFCFARRNPYIGYCQGMNFILNFLLTMQFSEQQCFWILASVLQELTPFTYYTNMSGVATDITIIELILKTTQPKIYRKLQELEIDISIFMLEWFVCLYTSTLPFYLLVIVWDLLIMEGSIVLLKVAMVLVNYFRGIIEETSQFAEFFMKLEKAKKNIQIQEETFLKMLNQVYIDEELLQIARKVVGQRKFAEKEEIRNSMKKSEESWKEIQCNVEWPICFQLLKKQKSLDEDVEVWVFKDQSGPRLITDYLPLKVKRVSTNQKTEDLRDPDKKIIIGRIPHICDYSSYYQKQYLHSRQIELDDLDLGMRRINKNLQGVLSQKLSTSAQFFRRATMNKLAFMNTLAKFQNSNK